MVRLGNFTAVAQVQSLVRELRSCKPHGTAKKKEKSPVINQMEKNIKKECVYICVCVCIYIYN